MQQVEIYTALITTLLWNFRDGVHKQTTSKKGMCVVCVGMSYYKFYSNSPYVYTE